jgi:hypothetical protein
MRIQTSTERYLSGFVFCLRSCCLLHLLRRHSYTPTYLTVLTIVHLDGTSILSLYTTSKNFYLFVDLFDYPSSNLSIALLDLVF